MDEHVDALLVQAVQAESESSERVRRPRVRSGPRPPTQPRQPVVLSADDLLLGYYALTEAMISQARLDLAHKCWPSGCKVKHDCHRRRSSAQHFLRELRAGRAPLWSDWISLAETRVRP